jgi:hypothetical protein
MRSHLSSSFGRREAVTTIVAAVLVLLPSLIAPGGARPASPGPVPSPLAVGPGDVALAGLENAPRALVPDAPSDAIVPGSSALTTVPTGVLPVVVTLQYSNASRLSALLAKLADPATSRDPGYLTAAQFDAEFAPAPRLYGEAVAYFGSFGVQDLTTYADRATVTFEATPTVATRIFGAPIASFELDGRAYLAPTGPIRLPAPLAASVLQVEGLGTASSIGAGVMNHGLLSPGIGKSRTASAEPSVSGYLSPPTRGSAQIEYAPDFQVAYDEQSLLEAYGAPAKTNVALITGSGRYSGPTISTACGNLSNGTDVGGWDPSDVAAFFASTLPNGQPSPTVTGVPIGGAAAPGCLASWDTSGAAAANTVDLEMIGSTAPGAAIYGVYGPSMTVAALDTELATVLNPGGASLPAGIVAGLDNVSVVATAWCFSDRNDSAWYIDLQQAEVRGITVLAAAGNSADDPASAGWVGSDAEFPASMAYRSFGDTAVGGTTVTLHNASLQIANEIPWNVSASDTAGGGPAGTAGGISSAVHEPIWQKGSSANATLAGKGRGVPDVAGLANDTAATVTVDGTTYDATNASGVGLFYNASGTGIAVSLVAGLFAEIDHALVAAGDLPLGFADPTVYSLGNQEYAPLPNGSIHFSVPSGNYTSPLPTLPFHDVVTGRNFVYRAGTGYDLVTGWGSLDAYNFTIYVLSPSTIPSYGPLRAIDDYVNLTALDINPTTELENPNASIQQNFFLADSLGAPIIWVQAVVDLVDHVNNGTWGMSFSGWVVYPFWGIYPNESVYEAWQPTSVQWKGLPASLDLTTYLTVETPSWEDAVTFDFGGLAGPFTLTVPGAAYILGGFNDTYNWQGLNYTDGPRGPVASVPGFLAPQVGLYGTGGGEAANFTDGTAGTIHAYVEPFDSASFEEAAETAVVTLTDTQTGETAENLVYTRTSPNNWSFAYGPGAADQGISVGEPYWFPVQFSQTGAPAATTWYVNITYGPHLSGSGAKASLAGSLQNGSYGWVAGISSHNYSIEVGNGNLTVDGSAVQVALVFLAKTNSVTFLATGNETFPFGWAVTITYPNGTLVQNLAGTGSGLETTLTYAKYDYRAASDNSSWAPTHTTGTFTIGSTAVSVQIAFSLVTYKAKITPEYGIGILVPWTVTVDGVKKKGYATTPFTFPLPNGTYSFEVGGLPPGYSAVPSNGTFVVHGLPAPNVGIRIVPPNGAGGLFGLGVWGYVLVGGVAAAVLLALFLVLRRRRARGGSGRSYVPPDEI